MTDSPKYTNRLIHESSPYLLQHAHNPVDWYPWGDEALEAARDQDKPILLSIGYSACHWCHVMEHESFEDPATAQVMKDLFISIKVDREERPDLDNIYMMAVQMMTGRGGWPMTVFLTPDRVPFVGGTYFPPVPKMGMPSFQQVLHSVSRQYHEHRDDVAKNAKMVLDNVQQLTAIHPTTASLDARPLELAYEQCLQTFDERYGGFGGAPKFPGAMTLRLLLRHWKQTGESNSLNMVTTTLDAMAQGGIYDHLGGGFHRYSVDARWLIPHFEKMLYDNGLLVPAYLEAYQATGNEAYAQVVRDTLDYVLREMTDPAGGFYSTQDADSEGEEGKFFAWTPEQVEAVLGADDAAVFCAAYGVTPHGNFEHGTSVLHIPDPSGISAPLQQLRAKLFAHRENRIKPDRDDKILTAWNGLMISAMALGGQVLGEPKYSRAAAQAADFVFESMTQDGRLLRTYRHGHAKLNGYHEDYAYLAVGLIDLYEATFDTQWIERANTLVNDMMDRFYDETDGGFFFTSRDHEELYLRDKNPYDGATPSANAMAVHALLRLSALTGNDRYYQAAEKTLHLFLEPMMNQPGGFAQMISALDLHQNRPVEIVLAGNDTAAMLKALHQRYIPNKVVAACPEDGPTDQSAAIIPLLAGKTAIDGKAAAYLCRQFTCAEPITDLDRLGKALA